MHRRDGISARKPLFGGIVSVTLVKWPLKLKINHHFPGIKSSGSFYNWPLLFK